MTEKTYKYSPDEPEKLDNLIVESYDNLVQLERRNLLLVSSIVLFSVFANIDPASADFLGLTFKNFSEMHFYVGLSFLVFYFLVAYFVYGYPSFKAALKAKKEISKKSMAITRNIKWHEIMWRRLSLDFKYIFWLVFHYIFPIFFGCFAIIVGVLKVVLCASH